MPNFSINEQKTIAKLPPLTNVQKEAVDFIMKNWFRGKNSLCAMGIGLGKTRVACEIISYFLKSENLKLTNYILVCCANATTRDTIWVDTFAQYDIKTIVLSGNEFVRAKLKKRIYLDIHPKTVGLITYANLIRTEQDGTPIINYFQNTPPSFIVFDEMHTISNSFDRTEQHYRNAILKLPLYFRLGLTATPLVNDEKEMLLSFGILNFPKICETFGESNAPQKIQEITRLARESNFFYFKHLPYKRTPCSDWLISIPMDKELYEKYNELSPEYNDDKEKNQSNDRLRFIIEGSYGQGKKQITYQTETGKMKALRLIIKHANRDDKIIIFDNFTHTLDFIAQREWIREYNPIVHHGKKTESENRKSYERFMEDEKCRIFLTTRSKCAEGINLQKANHVVIMNCWWTVKDYIQMVGRVKRMGQFKPVYTYLLGYNLFSLHDEKTTSINKNLLPEELSLYNAVRKKIFVNKFWDIDVREEMPKIKAFENPMLFEENFGTWLDTIVLHDISLLESANREKKEEATSKEKMNNTVMEEICENIINYTFEEQMQKLYFEKIWIPFCKLLSQDFGNKES
jgi:superfamily II DNA or RNA helicase